MLTVVIPAYNAQDYIDRAVTSVRGFDGVEVLIVDDGSHDKTAQIADEWVARDPEHIRVIHQENAGHGGAVNAGIASARGRYLKILDADDWLDRLALKRALERLALREEQGEPLDLLVANYVYEKQGKSHKAVIRYGNVIPRDRVVSWDEVKRCRYDQYLMMHALILRTELVRECGLVLPTHTFYVDFIYSFVPVIDVRSFEYLDVDLYRYFIGRDDQSVNEQVMISRVDQLLRVNAAMVDAIPHPDDVPPKLYRYLVHYLRINCVICTVMLLRSGTEENAARKDELWAQLEAKKPEAYRAVRRDLLGRLITLRSKPGRAVIMSGYHISQWVLGFN